MGPIFSQIHRTLSEAEGARSAYAPPACDFRTPRIRAGPRPELTGQTVLDGYGVVDPGEVEISGPEEVHDVFVGGDGRGAGIPADNTVALLSQAALLMDE